MSFFHPIRKARKVFNARAQAVPALPPIATKQRALLGFMLAVSWSLYFVTFYTIGLALRDIPPAGITADYLGSHALFVPMLVVLAWALSPMLYCSSLVWFAFTRRDGQLA
ncbi:hypothetical protein AB4Y45_32550 [Paraburkholderia sp. EG287A]|uniref:hypothetical protein n=1 Tax=Paraburkholderia sp. EG287A TaxID=3237012 RepID=UPI0034D15CDE